MTLQTLQCTDQQDVADVDSGWKMQRQLPQGQKRKHGLFEMARAKVSGGARRGFQYSRYKIPAEGNVHHDMCPAQKKQTMKVSVSH